jgi:hypothetical protein
MDELEWGAMRHAYGSAVGVPELVRGLIDADAAVREVSLDAMYGAVHHQGDIYDSTVAAVPFLLEALGTPGLPGRDGIARFLTSVVESGRGADPDGVSEVAKTARTGLRLITEAVPGLLGLASDPDPAVRAAVASLLVLHRDGVALLVGRAAAETDPAARAGMIEGLGRSADPAVAEHLLGVAAGTTIASVAVAALIAAAHIAPERVPSDGVVELMRRAYAEGAEPAGAAGFETGTLVGALRVRRERSDEGRRNPHVARSIDGFAKLLGPRVAERTATLAELLRDPHEDVVQDALFGAGHLIERWRGDYRELVELVAAQLPNPWAARGLNHWVPLSAPAADALAVDVARGDGLVHHQVGPPSLAPSLSALIQLGDERAFEPLVAIVAAPVRPTAAAQGLRRFPQHAERIVDLLLTLDLAPDDIAVTLGACGAAARPAVSRLLTAPLKAWTAQALGRIGGDEAAAALRSATSSTDVAVAVAAAGALWHLESTADTNRSEGPKDAREAAGPKDALNVLEAHLPSALKEVAAIGPAAEHLLPKIRKMTDISDKWYWIPVNAAIAVWRIGGEQEAATPALVRGWHGNKRTRARIAEQAGDLPALWPLFEAELAEPQRAGTDDHSFSPSQVADDERFQDSMTRSIAARDRRVNRR